MAEKTPKVYFEKEYKNGKPIRESYVLDDTSAFQFCGNRKFYESVTELAKGWSVCLAYVNLPNCEIQLTNKGAILKRPLSLGELEEIAIKLTEEKKNV